MIDEYKFIEEIKKGNKKTFSDIFNKYYKDLVLFGGCFLQNKSLCEDIVQTVFLKLWRDRESLVIEVSLRSFLLRSVQNACLDELRHKEVIRKHEAYSFSFQPSEYIDTEHYILHSDLQNQLTDVLNKIPKNCREAFEMNRFEGLKYNEIAKKLNVSERTIQVRIGKALFFLRKYLKEFLLALVFVDIIDFFS